MSSKMTKKERREAAKKARMEAQRRAARARRLRKVYGVAGTVGVIALIVGLLVWNSSRSREAETALNDLAAAASCSDLEKPAIEGRDHVNPPASVDYRTDPPTSGNHFGAWDPTGGPHQETIQAETYVHNLEHGHVVLQYKPDVSDSIKTVLEDVATAQPTWVISMPNPSMTPTIAFTAWGRLMTCDGSGSPDQIRAVAQRFADTQRENGPERIPL